MASYNAINHQTEAQLIFTDSAALKVHELIQEEDNPDLNLRVFITGGGCSGFQYGFTFDDAINDDDMVIEKQLKLKLNPEDEDGGEAGGADVSLVRLLVDALSFQYLSGAEIDYREDLQGAQFIIRNPHARTTCGCGSSFSI